VEQKEHLHKEIGLFTLTSLGVGAIIGSGIFALPASMAVVAGPGLILAILISGLISLCLALSYAELGAAFPLTGGPYSLPRLAMGDLGGFIMGWGYFLYLFIGTAGIIDIFVVYLGYYIPGLAIGTTLTPLGISIAVIAVWIFTFINIYGVKWGGLYGVITTIGKIIPLILIVIAGFTVFDGNNFSPFMPFGFTGVTIGVTLFFWSYTGFEALVIPTGEVKNPRRNIPLSIILTMVICIVVYLLIAVVFVGMINWKGLSFTNLDWIALDKLSSPLSQIAEAAKGGKLLWLGSVIAVGAIIATGGSGGSWVLFQGRMPYAMAKDKLFWGKMNQINKHGVPSSSLLLTSLLTTIILISIPSFPAVALIASMTGVLAYAAAVLSIPILRKTKPNTPRPFKLPIQFVFTIVTFILATFLLYWASWPWTLVGVLLLLTAYPVFLFVRRSNFEFYRTAWVPVYLVSVLIISFIGDPHFYFNDFTGIRPLGILKMPYDLIVLTILSIVIYFWAYKVNTREHLIDKNEKIES
jgi:amino acid transporter